MSNENKIRILYVQPGKYPEEQFIANELHPLQRLVGGYMQAVYPCSKVKVALVCNDSGKVDGLPLNRCIEDYDVIAGNFFICGFSGGEILHQLLSEEMRPSLLALCGVIAVADGELCWPLPGHTYISCHFGEVDAFGNAGHRGTDIPAPEGTPILAAHSGTVIISGWNNSYGNQVLLDNGAGLSTRYAHMTQTAVTAGEAVTAGQVIGYVGNTGDSTGFHLHFEVMQNGVRVNPMDMVSVR